jgi:uncharacterized membrane protein (DUF4010 family)
MTDDIEIAWRLASALGIGLLIGLERGWQDRALPEGRRIAGFRTCAIVALLGAIAALLGESFDDSLPVAALIAAIGGLLAVGYWHDAGKSSDLSVTTAIAVLTAFALGTLAGLGMTGAAAAAAVVVTLLLGLKPELHGFLQRLDRKELLATLRLLLISVVILPVLPDRGFGPFGALNPYQLWWLVVLIAGLSFAGYLAMILVGAERGILLTGLLGGLASSTAVTVNLARLGREHPAAHKMLAGGIVAAGVVMFLRLLAVVAVLGPTVILLPLAALAPAAVVGGLVALWLARQARPLAGKDKARLMPSNPLNLSAAVQFGALLALLSLLSRLVQEWAGTVGLYALAALSGIADVDAITLSLLTGGADWQVGDTVKGTAIVIAAAINTIVKAGLALAIGGTRIGIDVCAGLGSALAAGALGLGLYVWL